MASQINLGAWQVMEQGAWQTLSGAELPPENPYPITALKKKVITGYHCFMAGYMDAKRKGFDPLKLPDGTIF